MRLFCRSRKIVFKILQSAYLDANIGFDTEETEPLKLGGGNYSSLRLRASSLCSQQRQPECRNESRPVKCRHDQAEIWHALQEMATASREGH